jgi:hypothetical protein
MGTEEKNNTAERRNWSNFFCVLNRSILERQGGTGDSDMLIALRSPEHWELRALLRFQVYVSLTRRSLIGGALINMECWTLLVDMKTLAESSLISS